MSIAKLVVTLSVLSNDSLDRIAGFMGQRVSCADFGMGENGSLAHRTILAICEIDMQRGRV